MVKVDTARLSIFACLLALLVGACRETGERTSRTRTTESASGLPGRLTLLAVPPPDLSGMEQLARTQVQASYSSLMAKVAAPGLSTTELGAAYGETGKLFMAAEYDESAEPCFLNAAALIPDDARWTYYLGHLYKRTGDLVRSAAYFERTINTQPDNVATLWWLGSVRLDQGRAGDAGALFAKALSLRPDAWETLYGLGRTALARKDYAKAAEYFERILSMNPRAMAAHYQLGLAYRGLGKLLEAESHVRLRSDAEVRPPDPLMAQLDELLHTSIVYQSRAVQAGKAGAWPKAVADFRKAVEIDPQNTSALLGLGVALYHNGHATEAFERVSEALRISPRFARAHYVAGTLLAISGRDREAIRPLTAAIKYDLTSVEAHISLAQALQRIGRQEEALAQYREVLTRVPGDSEGQFGSAIALVRLGRHQEALVRLSDGSNAHPDEVRFPHALARLLAAAPDARVRDGRRARAISEALFQSAPTIEGAETMAMALAEVGQFDEATAWQRRAITAVEQEGQADLARQMARTLQQYQRGEPCRTPWRADDPIFHPRPPTNPAP
jgi:tetratricopeptide (TPR) repeat protein